MDEKFKVGQRVIVKSNVPDHNYVKSGMAGMVKRVSNLGSYGNTYEVNLDGDVIDTTINEKYLQLEEEKNMTVSYRIVGPRGFTECLTKTMVGGLKNAGILFHTETHVHDDELVKIYKNVQEPYKVKDFRSNRVSLEEQFPKDN